MSTSFTNMQAIPIDGALPTQNTGTAGKALISNGTNVGWNTILSMIGAGAGQTVGSAVANVILPAQTGQASKVLATDGAGNLSWQSNAADAIEVSSVSINGIVYTGDVVITNVPSATVAGNVSGIVALANGGTGATSQSGALTAIGAAPLVHTHNYAPLADPAFTGTPVAPTAPPGTNTTQLATTAFTNAAITAATPGIVAQAVAAPTAFGTIGTYFVGSFSQTYASMNAVIPTGYPGTWMSRGITGSTGIIGTQYYLMQRVA
jgi:hypothetical protein